MNKGQTIGYLLMNIGTPSDPSIKGIRKFLKEFLSDPDVIDSNSILRWAIVNLIVAPFRPKKILHQYESIWMKEGSPLIVYSERFKSSLINSNSGMNVEVGMRYGEPSIEDALGKFKSQGVSKIIICPMFPQYAQATTGSCISRAIELIDNEGFEYSVLNHFYNEEFYIDCMVDSIKNNDSYKECDLLLFSFHGLPERQIKRLDTSGSYCINTDNCCEQASEFNEFCYRFHCSLTVQKIMEKLGTDKSYRMCFQSRFGMDKWIQPDILTVLQDSTNNGVKNIAVSCPSFVADCLETLEEIAIRDKDAFIAMGGEKLDLIPSLNDSHDWVIGFSDYLYRNS